MSEKARVLVVEDEQDVRDLMVLHLKRDGYEPDAVDNGEEALRRLEKGGYGLAIVDWMLPGISGLEICKRAQGRVPVLMVTARSEAADIVLGLEAGADDYVSKPFEIPVFLARARALLRRAQLRSTDPDAPLVVGGLRLDPATYEVTCAGEGVGLTPYEFKLLRALMTQRGRVLSRERLIDSVQGSDVVVTDRAIDTHVFSLRKKLGTCADAIETIRGVGYRIRAE
jgi:two-component system phosphate regulon response regulator PhoB